MNVASEIACSNLQERTDMQTESNEKLSFPQYQQGDHRCLYTAPIPLLMDPNPKLISPWRGPFTVRSQQSPVIDRVARDGELAENQFI